MSGAVKQLTKIRTGLDVVDRAIAQIVDVLNPVLRALPGLATTPTTPAGAAQTGTLYMGKGAPANANGESGDFYLRTDTPGTVNQRLYVKNGTSWAAIL